MPEEEAEAEAAEMAALLAEQAEAEAAEWDAVMAALRKQMARDIRDAVKLSYGPNAREILERGGTVHLNSGEADVAADAAIKALARWLEFSMQGLLDSYVERYLHHAARADKAEKSLDRARDLLKDAATALEELGVCELPECPDEECSRVLSRICAALKEQP